jgi:LysM repeat protein
VNDLTALNQLSSETIFPNQVLLVPPTVTPWPETGPFPHTVSRGETLLSIAALYRVTVDEIKALNGFTSDTIFAGQQVLIPASGVRPPTPTPLPEPWAPAIITGELDIAYPFTRIGEHFTLHFAPDSRTTTSSEMEKVTRLVQTALDYSQEVLQRRFAGHFEVYVSNSLFDAPYTAQLSFSEPSASRLFLLYDDTTTPEERLYFVTYALIQMTAVHMLGEPASPLLIEGLAVYAAGRALSEATPQGRDYLSLNQFCAALQQTGALPRLTQPLELEGHLGYLDQYLAAGCFIGHLIETEGTVAYSQVYLNGNYSAAYGKTLEQLVFEWGASLRSTAEETPVDPDELVEVITEINDAYRRLWADFEGTSVEMAAYQWLDRARSALLQGNLEAAQQHLNALEALLSESEG